MHRRICKVVAQVITAMTKAMGGGVQNRAGITAAGGDQQHKEFFGSAPKGVTHIPLLLANQRNPTSQFQMLIK